MGEQARSGAKLRDVIGVGASAGGVEAIQRLLSDLPKNFPAIIFVVIHLSPTSPSLLPLLISRKTGFPAVHPADREVPEHGKIYVAPPDYHMEVVNGRIRLEKGPRENRHRPAIDPLFRSLATQYRSRAIGIILTGSLDDGTAGLQAIKLCGGLALVQHPEDAMYPGMPENALRSVEVDHCVPLAKMGALLQELVGSEPLRPESSGDCSAAELEQELASTSISPRQMRSKLGAPNGFICPECNGPLWDVKEGKHTVFRCLVGHQYSMDSFLAEETEALERSLWVAVKTLEERVTLMQRMAARSNELGQMVTAEGFNQKATESDEHAATIRRLIQRLKT